MNSTRNELYKKLMRNDISVSVDFDFQMNMIQKDIAVSNSEIGFST